MTFLNPGPWGFSESSFRNLLVATDPWRRWKWRRKPFDAQGELGLGCFILGGTRDVFGMFWVGFRFSFESKSVSQPYNYHKSLGFWTHFRTDFFFYHTVCKSPRKETSRCTANMGMAVVEKEENQEKVLRKVSFCKGNLRRRQKMRTPFMMTFGLRYLKLLFNVCSQGCLVKIGRFRSDPRMKFPYNQVWQWFLATWYHQLYATWVTLAFRLPFWQHKRLLRWTWGGILANQYSAALKCSRMMGCKRKSKCRDN